MRKKTNNEEVKILASFEKGEWQSTADKKRKAQVRGYARSTMAKDRRITLRIASADLEAIQAMALQEGIPYQTLISSIVHKYVTRRAIPRD